MERSHLASSKRLWILEPDHQAQAVYADLFQNTCESTILPDLTSFSRALKTSPGKPDLLIADVSSEQYSTFFSLSRKKPLESTPIIVVSAIDEIDALQTCFQNGASDYLTKPFNRKELFVKVARTLTQSKRPDSETVEWLKDLVFQPAMLTVQRGNLGRITLTAKELQIFSVLHRSAGAPVTRQALEDAVWSDSKVISKSIDVHIFNLRKKLSQLQLSINYGSPEGYWLASSS